MSDSKVPSSVVDTVVPFLAHLWSSWKGSIMKEWSEGRWEGGGREDGREE